MGVHPGCPVCSIVAASLVAVETDVGETVSVAKVALVCGLWSVGVGTAVVNTLTPRPTPLKKQLNSLSKMQMLKACVIANRG